MKVIISAMVILMVTAAIASPIQNDFSGEQSDVWHDDSVIHPFFGPWTNIRKPNSDYADESDYGAHVPAQDYSPSNEDLPADDPLVIDGPASDFQSNYGEVSDDGSQTNGDQSNLDSDVHDNESESSDDQSGANGAIYNAQTANTSGD